MYAEPVYNEIGALIRVCRKKANLSQADLADRLKLKRSSISNIERGKQRVYIHTLIEIARILNIGLELLIPGIRPPSQITDSDFTILPVEEQMFLKAALGASTDSPEE